MSKSKMKQDFRKMVKWSIRKMFENSPNDTISLKELETQLQFAWDELIEEGDVIIKGEEKP